VNDVTKLPRWAQDKIALLERNLEYAKKQLAALDNENGMVTWESYPEKHGIPPTATVRFRLNIGNVEARIDGSGDHLRVSTTTGRLVVLPGAANTVHIEAR